MIISILYVVFILFIWFDTTVFIDYSKLLKLDKLFLINKWEDYRLVNPKIEYLNYLNLKHRSFFTKLIVCKPCLSFWISFSSTLIFTDIIYLPFIYLTSYLIYNLYTCILWKLKKY